MSCYAPPGLAPAAADSLLEYLSNVIAEGKRKYPDCTLIIGGDFTQWPAENIVQDHPELREVGTRQGRKIDLSFVNFASSIVESAVLRPLETKGGPEPTARDSRHATAFKTKPLQVLKYIEDNVINEKANFDTSPRDGADVKDKHVVRTQSLFCRVTFQVESNVMKVHSGKTTSMCMSETKPYVPERTSMTSTAMSLGPLVK